MLALCPFVENSLYSLLFAQSKLVVGGVAQWGLPLTFFVRVAATSFVAAPSLINWSPQM